MSYAAAYELPEEIEEKIAKEHLASFSQLVAFSGVCRSWNSIAKEHYYNNLRSSPGILVSKTSCTVKNCDYYQHGYTEDYYCDLTILHHQFQPISTIFNNIVPPHPPPLRLTWSPQRILLQGGPTHKPSVFADLEKYHCIASKGGWLVLLQHCYPVRFFLFNPITGASILLPPLQTDDGYLSSHHFDHVILSSSPGDDHEDCYLIVLFHLDRTPQVTWCKVISTGGGWKYTTCYSDSKLFNFVQCACYIEGKLYVVDHINKCVVVIDNLINVTDKKEDPPTVRSFPFSFDMALPDEVPYVPSRISYHATDLNRQLILVLRDRFEGGNLHVYKLVEEDPCNKYWEQVRSLDGHAVFVGTHQSFSVLVNKNSSIRSDSVYYLENSCGQCELDDSHELYTYWYRRSRNEHWGACGIFSLADGKLVEQSRLPTDSYQDYRWFLPMPWDIAYNNKKKIPLKPKEIDDHKKKIHRKPKEIDGNGFQLPSNSKVTRRNRLRPQQLASNRIIPCHNSFEALALVD